MHELFEELDAFDERWRLKYATLYEAAQAAGVVHMYENWARATVAGRAYVTNYENLPDYKHAEDQRIIEE
jgi:hypothetical protein